jgi:hypothetical protein
VERTWFSRRAISLHLVLIVLLPAFSVLCWWQIDRALSGNELSWVYVFEWPFFGVYAIYMWWRFLHDPGGAAPPPGTRTRRTPKESKGRTGTAPSEEAELAAYNRYLQELDATGERKHW